MGRSPQLRTAGPVVKLGAVTGTIAAPEVAPEGRGRVELSGDEPGLARRSPARLARPVVAVHAVTLALAFGVWAYWDRNLWFFGDEWDFLTRRGLHGATFSIWKPHNEHWSVLPILLWRALFSVAHLSTYWPYLVPLLLAHVVVVHLLWRRCLREGADPWVATGLALLFALFGTGAEDLTWAFQVGFVSSLVFGLAALEVAEGRHWSDLRPHGSQVTAAPLAHDMGASLLAIAALMCSDVGVAMAVALGVVVLARYGWRRCARVLAVPVAAYLTWFALAGYTGLSETGDTFESSVLLKLPRFVGTNLKDGLGHAAAWPAAGVFIAIAVGAWLLWRSPNLFRRHPAVLGGAVAAVSFYAMAGLGRDRISATLSPSRYAYIGMALLLPAIALMITALPAALARWRQRLPGRGLDLVPRAARYAMFAAVVVATLGNMSAGLQFARSRTTFVRGLKNQIITTAALLQSKEQMAQAIDVYPVWASGFASGYLTPSELSLLYRQHYLPRPRDLMTVTQVREDESWLDLYAVHRRMFDGRFRAVYRSGVTVAGPAALLSGLLVPVTLPVVFLLSSNGESTSAPAPGRWPSGPGVCVYSSPAGFLDRTMTFAAARATRSASLWISLGAAGGRVHFYLGRAWGFRGPRGDGFLKGETVNVPARGDVWLNDSVPSTGLVLALSGDQRAKLCGLQPSARRR